VRFEKSPWTWGQVGWSVLSGGSGHDCRRCAFRFSELQAAPRFDSESAGGGGDWRAIALGQNLAHRP